MTTLFSDPGIGLRSDLCRYAHTHTHTYRCNGSASELDVGENERPQLRMVAEKIFLHFFLLTIHSSVCSCHLMKKGGSLCHVHRAIKSAKPSSELLDACTPCIALKTADTYVLL